MFSILVNGTFVYFCPLSTQVMVLTHCYVLNMASYVIFSFFQTQRDVNRLKNLEILANDFADYFIGKISKIRDQLQDHKLFIPGGSQVTSKLFKFAPMDKTEVRKILISLNMKHCELGVLRTYFIKENLDYFLDTITNLV